LYYTYKEKSNKIKNFFKKSHKKALLALDKQEKIRYNDVYDCEKDYAVRKMGAYEA